jgi:hypothetical protein
LVGSFSAATELLGRVSSIQAAKTPLKGESAERREFQIRESAREESRQSEYSIESIRQRAREETS